MNSAPIYVAVAADDINGRWLKDALERDPQRQPNPIVFETNVIGATLEKAQARAAALERAGYGAVRVGRVVFDDEPAFNPPGASQ